MGLLERLVQGAEYRSSLATPSDWLIDALSGATTTSGERVTVTKSLGLIAVFSAVSKIAETIGMLPLKVFHDLGDGEKEEAPEHRAWRMLHDMPNPVTPAHRFWSTVAGHVLLWGNSFIEQDRSDSGLVDTLWLLDPARVTVEWSEQSRVKRFKYQMQTGELRMIPEQNMAHVMDFSLDGIVGQSRIARCRDALGKALARERFEANFFNRGGTFRGVIEYPGRLQSTEKIRESWQAVYGGAANAHKVAVLEEGATWKPMQMPLQDMQFVESGVLSRTDIAILFNLPPAQLGGSSGDSLTYATVEGNSIQFATQSIAPVANNIAKTLERDRGIFPFPAWWPEFELKALMRGDSKARAELYEKAQGKWMTRDEIRALEGLGPWEGPETPIGAEMLNGNGVEVPIL